MQDSKTLPPNYAPKPWETISNPDMPSSDWEQVWAPQFDVLVQDGNVADAIRIAHCAHYSYFYFLSGGCIADETTERVFLNSKEAMAAIVRATWWRSKLQSLIAVLPDKAPIRAMPELTQFGFFCEFFDRLLELDQSMVKPRKPKPSPIPR